LVIRGDKSEYASIFVVTISWSAVMLLQHSESMLS